LSTRANKGGEQGARLFVDLRCGDLQNQRIVRVETARVNLLLCRYFSMLSNILIQ